MSVKIDFQNRELGESKKIIWTTDLHLDACEKSQYRLFFELVSAHEPDVLLIGGDISNGPTSLHHLEHLVKFVKKPIYFVLGNHDFYYDSIEKTRLRAEQLAKKTENLHYLTGGGVVPLTDNTALIGHDGWCDARVGDFLNSTVMLNDYYLIDELKKLNQEERLIKLNQLGTESAESLRGELTLALQTYDRVILLTHVPPFEEACLYQDRPTDANWAPHFINYAAGQAIQEVMESLPSKQLLVLCGHTHCGHSVSILPNLKVTAGHSELGAPSVQGLISIN